jgi:nitroreductase/NAD-dependent dihydropyrimidine dehydrogenase PreA subunit
MPTIPDDLKPILRPEGCTPGKMAIDADKCIACGKCVKNCPFKCFEIGEDKKPFMKEETCCFSCFNCMVACPEDAVSIVESYSAKGGFFDTDIPPVTMPESPKGPDGEADEWTTVEKTILERRSVRNFSDKPVSEHSLRRIIEAGRFAPSAGNAQPWSFVAITNTEVIKQIEEACHAVWSNLYGMYNDDDQVAGLAEMFGKPLPVGLFDPRVWGGAGCVTRKELPIFMGANALVLLLVNDKMPEPTLQMGICGQNMNLAAESLGLGACWVSFSLAINFLPELQAMLGIKEGWRVQTSIVVGHPKFKQEGMVPRQKRPVTWFRPGSAGAELEE